MSVLKQHYDELAHRKKATHLLLRTCVTCEMFDLQSETCRQFNARPPANIIAYGCDEYIEEIPF